ncbi:hypothetical protein [Megamonas funiformis]|uniref:hypothetical protein n=1 Tax=Megamonas funiformis TaxID=437897 RepID=UPI0026762576|nr:hypothetical protein [Megamonas funiformis]
MPIHTIIDDVVRFIAKEWSQDKLNSCTDFDRIAKTVKNMYPKADVSTVKVAQVLGLLNGRAVVSIYDTYHPLDLLWSGYVEEVPDKYKTDCVFAMEHNSVSYQLYI